MAADLINYLQEIRGIKELGEIAQPTERNGIYHDLTKRTVNDDGTPRVGEGIYGSIRAMHGDITPLASIANSIRELANIKTDIISVNAIKSSVTAVGDSIVKVNNVALSLPAIEALNANQVNVDLVAANIDDVVTVAAVAPAIAAGPANAVAASEAKIATEYARDEAIAATHLLNTMMIGPSDTPPTAYTNGDPLEVGTMYYDTSITPKKLKIWNGNLWDTAAFDATGTVVSFNGREGVINLRKSDVDNLRVDAETVNTHTIASDVPIDAKFTDTIIDTTAIDTHIADTTKHFTQSDISITTAQISDFGAYADAASSVAASDIGVTIQGYNADTVVDSKYVHTDNNYRDDASKKIELISVSTPIDLDKVVTDVASTSSAIRFRGSLDLSTELPDSNARLGDSWIISGAGTIDTTSFDVNDRIIATRDNPSRVSMSDWHKLDYTDSVLSVAGKTGAIVLTPADVALPKVNNTADMDKPASTDTLALLALKANKSDVLTPVPYGAVFVDTTYAVGNNGLTSFDFTQALRDKLIAIDAGATGAPTKVFIDSLGINAAAVNGHTVGTTVPVNAKFTDTAYDDTAIQSIVGAHTTKLATVESGARADQTKADIDNLLINAATVNGFTVAANVPSNAIFTDTTYTVGDGGLSANNFTTVLKNKLLNFDPSSTAALDASELLDAIKAIDGSSSGIDADLLDGQEGSFYTDISNMTTGVIDVDRIPNNIPRDITGKAAVATKLETPRSIGVTGDITATSKDFDGTGNVLLDVTVQDNSHNHIIGNVTGLNTALNDRQLVADKGVANGYAELNSSGKVPSSQLPSYASTIVEVADFGSLPATGADDTVYVTTDNGNTYRWGGTVYAAMDGFALGESIDTAYRGDRGAIAYIHSQSVHAPYDAEPNVQIDWDLTSGMGSIANKPLEFKPAPHEHNYLTPGQADSLYAPIGTAGNASTLEGYAAADFQLAGSYNPTIGATNYISLEDSGTVLSSLSLTNGVITDIATRTMLASDIGALGTLDTAYDSASLGGISASGFSTTDHVHSDFSYEVIDDGTSFMTGVTVVNGIVQNASFNTLSLESLGALDATYGVAADSSQLGGLPSTDYLTVNDLSVVRLNAEGKLPSLDATNLFNLGSGLVRDDGSVPMIASTILQSDDTYAGYIGFDATGQTPIFKFGLDNGSATMEVNGIDPVTSTEMLHQLKISTSGELTFNDRPVVTSAAGADGASSEVNADTIGGASFGELLDLYSITRDNVQAGI